ncbi:MAG TPA: hypothetical protein VFJ58_01405 [Armatimonadota bacterium]|nr:hypothetical protein [Armatimonadota bacterium]
MAEEKTAGAVPVAGEPDHEVRRLVAPGGEELSDLLHGLMALGRAIRSERPAAPTDAGEQAQNAAIWPRVPIQIIVGDPDAFLPRLQDLRREGALDLSPSSASFDPATIAVMEQMNEVGQEMIASLDRMHLLMEEIKGDLRLAREPVNAVHNEVTETPREDA